MRLYFLPLGFAPACYEPHPSTQSKRQPQKYKKTVKMMIFANSKLFVQAYTQDWNYYT